MLLSKSSMNYAIRFILPISLISALLYLILKSTESTWSVPMNAIGFSTARQVVVIVSNQKSGSSLFTSIFQSLPKALIFHEPLKFLQRPASNKSCSRSQGVHPCDDEKLNCEYSVNKNDALDLLRSIVSCNFSDPFSSYVNCRNSRRASSARVYAGTTYPLVSDLRSSCLESESIVLKMTRLSTLDGLRSLSPDVHSFLIYRSVCEVAESKVASEPGLAQVGQQLEWRLCARMLRLLGEAVSSHDAVVPFRQLVSNSSSVVTTVFNAIGSEEFVQSAIRALDRRKLEYSRRHTERRGETSAASDCLCDQIVARNFPNFI